MLQYEYFRCFMPLVFATLWFISIANHIDFLNEMHQKVYNCGGLNLTPLSLYMTFHMHIVDKFAKFMYYL